MIFVTVGTHTRGFDRLVKAIDEYAAIAKRDVFMQIGSSSYLPVSASHCRFMESHEIQKLINEADIVISHAGAGTIIQVLQLRKSLIVAPRIRKFNESGDDHQLQIATALSNQGRAVNLGVQIDPDSIGHAIEKVKNLVHTGDDRARLLNALRQQLENWATLPTAEIG